MKCASCGFENPAGFKFCGACGAPLGAAPQPRTPTPTPPPMVVPRTPAATNPFAPAPDARADERRTVTILFADISGFTAMSEKLDPEVVQEIMDRAFERLTAVITGFGGTIDKYIGDAVMALFGAPVALGDDPERAVRAGLGMQKVMTDYGEELKRTRGFGLAMRVGINTGKVIWGKVGGAGEKKFTVMGDAVNLASRLEHAAPIGGVLIGESTWRHVRTRFATEALEPIQVKGKSEPVRVYRVLGEIAAPVRATMVGPRTPFVGRDEEMSELLAAIAATKAGRGAVVTLEAAVGTGKSRMVLELRSDAEDRGFATLSARAAAFGQGSPFAPWSDLVHRAANLGTLAAAGARERLRAWLEETIPDAGVDARWLDELANVADPSDPEVQRRREQPARFRQGLLDALITWLWAWSKKTPIALFAEDVHWWPAPSLELLVGAAQVARKAPLLLVATRRPEPTAIEWPPDPADRVLSLGPLDDAALLTLAHGVLGSEVPRGLLARLHSASGGNPFFAEEIIQAYIDNGALKTSRERGGWIWDEARAQQAALPMTVEGVTQARIDALPARERRVLQMAAVAGRTFWLGLLAAMGEEEAYEALLQLTARDLVHSRRSRLAGEKEYAFKHATIQAVAYENALKRERVNDHRKVAEWLEARAGDSTELATTIAEHYLVAEEKAKALPHLLRASEEAVRAFDRHATVVDSAVEVAEALGDERGAAHALRLRGRLRRVALHPDAQSDLERAVRLAEAVADRAGVAGAARDLAGLAVSKGQLDFAERSAKLAHEAALESGAVRPEIDALNILGIIARRRGDSDTAMARYEQALARATEAGERPSVGMVLTSIGFLHLSSARYDAAVDAFTRVSVSDLSRENAAHLHCNLGSAFLGLKRHADAAKHLALAREAAVAIGHRSIEAEAQLLLGELDIECGRRDEGRMSIESALDLARGIGAAELVASALTKLAEVLETDSPREAYAALEEAQTLARERGDGTLTSRISVMIDRLRPRVAAS